MNQQVVGTAKPINGDNGAPHCERCKEAHTIHVSVGYGGRVVSVYCQRCRTTTMFQWTVCAECGALDGHGETCSFATPWAV
jgi:hypothetical protein